jgi:[methyl-Co(III) methanol-specific corrinoid protein]:coenzyme M methyltransferase
LTAAVGGPLILHICGDCSDRLDLIAESGFDAYHFEWQIDARWAVQQIGRHLSLVGNVNNPETLYRGTPDSVYSQARYAIEAGVDIIGPECAIPLGTPLENLKAIVAAVRDGY